MDCCNYVQPYNSGTGHFYHQQNHFYYENMNAYASYNGSMTPGSNAIETNVRYNRLPPAYPTDYVYNPKEARLRKAMREQSRELSRQSILQTAIASAASSGNGSGSGAVTSSSFLNHPLSCSSSSTGGTASPLQNGSPSVNSGRIINPWFPVGPASSSAHLKPIISPRMMAAHQRTLEKTKEAMRKQVECAASGVFSSGGAANPSSGSGYPGEFGSRNSPATSANDYCIIAEFGEGQKWHPYQNGGNPYHGRGGAAMPKVGLHPNANVHGPWTQFCGLPLQTSAVQNPVIRPSRQMVFLQEQQSQHCNAFTDEMQMSYVQAKMEPNHRLHLAYSGQGDPQVKASVSPAQMQQHQQQQQQQQQHQHRLQHEEVNECGEASQVWDSEATAGSSSGVAGVSNIIDDQTPQDQDEEDGSRQTSEVREEAARQKPINGNKQPLPGFHQAFGSTEIGRFSRSEFFANMVGDGSNVSSNRGNPQQQQQRQVSPDCDLKGNAIGRSSSAFFNSQQSNHHGPGVSSFGNINNFGNVALAAYYNDIRSPANPVVANPRWHSPYVGVIGSEI
ncbi:uncharacterized protein LOC124310561 [Neodiprion virginianus]|uniref:uncharacterized protein LOC124310561 n=1 Tax=Neodiprion virginianus TaxID=2961670 RepID=UPI001EE69906|nr:uncharacterized protein LOC124310561 [Neodiprion virginianus]